MNHSKISFSVKVSPFYCLFLMWYARSPTKEIEGVNTQKYLLSKKLTFAVLHDDGQVVCCHETLFVADDIGMVQIFEQVCLHHAALQLSISKAFENHFLCHILLVFLDMVYDVRGSYFRKKIEINTAFTCSVTYQSCHGPRSLAPHRSSRTLPSFRRAITSINKGYNLFLD